MATSGDVMLSYSWASRSATIKERRFPRSAFSISVAVMTEASALAFSVSATKLSRFLFATAIAAASVSLASLISRSL